MYLKKNYQLTVSLIKDVTYMSNNHVVWYYRYFCLHLFHTHMYIYDAPTEAFLYFRTLVQVKYQILTIYIIWCPAVKKLKLKKKCLLIQMSRGHEIYNFDYLLYFDTHIPVCIYGVHCMNWNALGNGRYHTIYIPPSHSVSFRDPDRILTGVQITT